MYNIDIMLISETHFTIKSHFHVPKYNLYHTNHPDGTAHAGSAILVKSNMKHHVNNSISSDKIQATIIVIESSNGPVLISALYIPPKHNLKTEQYSSLFRQFGNRFIAGGDYNAKHSDWGARITTTKGRELMKTVQSLNLSVKSTGKPTYWPSDPKKKPDLVEFFVTKGLTTAALHCFSTYDLSSDHTPVLAELHNVPVDVVKPCKIHSKLTDWEYFRKVIGNTMPKRIPLKSNNDISTAIETFNKCVQSAAWEATPQRTAKFTIPTYPQIAVDLIKKKKAS